MISIRQTAKRLRQSNTGNAMMILALGLPALVGGAGYGLDMAQWYMLKRELQYAVDQAAVAGAYSLSYNGTAGDWSARAEQEYDANRSITTGYATANDSTKGVTDYGSFTQNSVTVSATMDVSLPFSSILLSTPTTINVNSQAMFEKTDGATGCMIALKPNDTAITINGNVTINAPCGMAVSSTSSISINKSGGSGSINPGWVYTGGGVNDKFQELIDKFNATAPAADQVEVNEDASGFVDPFASVTVPTVTGSGSKNCSTGKVSPGVFSGGIDVDCNLHFEPGVYVIDGGELKNNNKTITGSDVLFVFKNGGKVNFGGNSDAKLSGLTAAGAAALGYTGDVKDLMTGMLFMEDANNQSYVSHRWRGTSDAILDGRIYMPKSKVDISGTPSTGSQCTIVVSYEIELSGTAGFSSGCNIPSKSVVAVQENTRVRLVI
ncbi:TadE/TadG family type IV pilus assembly protein [Erythrobacter litoralis]|uniref:Putative Flp pilus-assembly TadG-like N-terminal domain-containing protein n=1 Tax=Erythrobacter litoralis (strain HTCC2594) TaxID=314225 RepID=Q2NAC5_ERYLH|nr:TadE/TadG family type IV pilus assembly protein [Erythrobacter litoralis]ABC63366.1 hypothetical protein ELI_06370 [Erythrobacter litoralis HTCC2594]